MGDLRYADAGVDIDEGNRAVSLIRRTIASTHTAQVLGGIGAFSGLFALEPGSPNGRVLASSTDSVGTKVKVAIATGRHRGIGIDLVNHCVNDILCCGAEPLFFLDYYATGKLVPEQLAELIEGIAEACRGAGLRADRRRDRGDAGRLRAWRLRHRRASSSARSTASAIIDGSRVAGGRRPPRAAEQRPAHQRLLAGAPHRRRARAAVVRRPARAPTGRSSTSCSSRIAAISTRSASCARLTDIRAMAHITGGGVIDNVPRVLPEGLAATIERSTWNIPPIFTAIQQAGGVHLEEMWRTFNMGVGMVVIVPADVPAIAAAAGIPVWRIGEVVPQSGTRRVILR